MVGFGIPGAPNGGANEGEEDEGGSGTVAIAFCCGFGASSPSLGGRGCASKRRLDGLEGGASEGIGGAGTDSALAFRSLNPLNRDSSSGGVLSRGFDGVLIELRSSSSISIGGASCDRVRGSSGGATSGDGSG